MFISATYHMTLSGMKSVFGYQPRLVQVVPGILFCMVMGCLLDSVTILQRIRSFGSILALMVATHFAIVVLVECTIRLILLRVGLIRVDTGAMTSNSNHKRMQEENKAQLDQHIQRSLIVHSLVHDRTRSTAAGEHSCCAPVGFSGNGSSCCSICLEEFKAEDTVISGRKTCCKSNIFHDECIQHWLRINDSCPCCRTPMLVAEHETDRDETSHEHNPPSNETSEINDIEHTEEHARNFLSGLRIQFDNVTRVWNESIDDMAA